LAVLREADAGLNCVCRAMHDNGRAKLDEFTLILRALCRITKTPSGGECALMFWQVVKQRVPQWAWDNIAYFGFAY
jgi:hypothetical protein